MQAVKKKKPSNDDKYNDNKYMKSYQTNTSSPQGFTNSLPRVCCACSSPSLADVGALSNGSSSDTTGAGGGDVARLALQDLQQQNSAAARRGTAPAGTRHNKTTTLTITGVTRVSDGEDDSDSGATGGDSKSSELEF